MVKLFLKAAFNTHSLAALVLGFTCTVLFAPTAVSQESIQDSAGPIALKPYKAEYKTTARGMSLTLNRQLKYDEDGAYTLTNGGSIFVVGFKEKAKFHVEGSRIIPSSYVYQGTGLMNRRREVHFTPDADTLRSLYKDKWYDLPYTDNTLDRMSQQEQMRLLLLNDATPEEDVIISVADGKRVKEYKLVYVGEEILQTPLGEIATLHFRREHDKPERKSDTWLAPAWDYLMVKTVHIEDGKPVEGMISKASINGRNLGPDEQ